MSLVPSWKEGALRDLARLDVILKKRIVKKILEFCESENFYITKKVRGIENVYRLRIGDYRVMFELHGNKIIILKVGHRKNIYD